MSAIERPVLILGAGINGAALARELVLNGVPVCLVDVADIASGTTAYSSRLIHGGLRYLEYGELDLVRESLDERNRWLRLAPHLVRPLQLFIPMKSRFSGAFSSLRKVIGWSPANTEENGPPPSRGLWPIRFGLWLYDWLAHSPAETRHRVHRVGSHEQLNVDAKKFRWLVSYLDGQLVYPERFTLELIQDAQQLAAEKNVPFQVLTYHRAILQSDVAEIRGIDQSPDDPTRHAIRPAAIVNATGAWVDETLAQLHVDAPRLMAGTKGSHVITFNERLRQALAGRGIYAEAADGRPIFVLPFLDGTLIGTTDEHFQGDPAAAVASREEIDYLLRSVNDIFPALELNAGDVAMHYSGVRPLPRTSAATAAAITRRHWLEEHRGSAVPTYSIIGGKLTTCRSLAESAAATILARLEQPVVANSRERPLPGGAKYPASPQAHDAELADIARQTGWNQAQVTAVWQLCGMRTREILGSLDDPARESLTGTDLPVAFVRWVIRHEWVTQLDDLVERRLMLVYHPRLLDECLRQLAEIMVREGRLSPDEVSASVQRAIHRLQTHFGKQVLAKVTSVVRESPSPSGRGPG